MPKDILVTLTILYQDMKDALKNSNRLKNLAYQLLDTVTEWADKGMTTPND